ncbi:MAG: hypothetical protein WA829_16180 [Candidatus Acidiferrum sp.]
MYRILGILMMSGDATSNPKHLLAMTLVKFAKKTSLSPLGAGDERLIAQKLGGVGSDIPPASLMP